MTAASDHLAHGVPAQLEAPKLLARRIGLTKGAVERLMAQGRLAFVQIGGRKYIPAGAWETFITDNTVRPCPDAIRVPASTSSISAGSTTFAGPRAGAAASAALARLTADKLKSRSPIPARPDKARRPP